jgi:hypothetical protein
MFSYRIGALGERGLHAKRPTRRNAAVDELRAA